jgi:pseudaminic acid cytidylyltransferase
MKVAIIPARGGSKRIPRKNIKEFNGKPIIAWSILAAQESGLFDHIIVSTDDSEIRMIAEKYGATVPFIRPSDISGDNTPTVPVIAHAIKEINKFYQQKVEYACCIYPCSPLVLPTDLIKASIILEESGEDFVYPVTEYTHPIFRSMRQSKSGKMEFLYPKYELSRTQDLEKVFHDAGQFYWGRMDAWVQLKKMHTDGVGMEIPSYRVVDIDTEDDWKRAEILFKMKIIT